MADRLYTSLKADEYISALRSATNLDKAVVARLAFAYSITTKLYIRKAILTNRNSIATIP